MSIKIDCKDQRVEDIMRDVKEKSESVIHGGWHVAIGKSNDPIMEFTNLDSLNEEECDRLVNDLSTIRTHLQFSMNSVYGIMNPVFGANVFTIRKFDIVNSLWEQVATHIKKIQKNNTDKTIIIDCKDKDMVDILKHISNALYGEVSNSEPNVEFKNLVSLTIDELKELNKQLDGLYTTIRNSISPLITVDVSQKTWRLHRILDLQRQIIKETQTKENEVKKVEEENEKKLLEIEYSRKTNEELNCQLEELEVVKDYYREWLQLYSYSRIHPTYKENIESILIEVNSRIDVINIILAHRELEESKHIDEIRNEKWNRYNNLEVEELEMILDALNVKCTLRKCELHKCEDNYESREIKKAMDEILDNMKIIKDVLKYKRGE